MLANGCASTQKGSSAELELLTYDAKVESESIASVSLVLPWELQNPTSTKATVGAAKWSLTIGDAAPVEGHEVLSVEAPPGATAQGELKVKGTISTSDEAFAARVGALNLPYKVLVTFEVSGSEPFEAEYTGGLFPPRKPEISLEARAGRFGTTSIELGFVLGVSNTNSFPITLTGLTYTLFVDEVEIAKGELAEGHKINSASELEFDIGKIIGKDDLKDLAKKLFEQPSIPYRLEAAVSLEGITIENPITGEIQFGQ